MKRIPAFILALVLMLSLLAVAPLTFPANAEGTQLIIHYRREDGNYANWDIWIWPEGKDGAAFPFTDTDSFGAVAVVDMPVAAARYGFIIRKGSWEAKDPDADRFIDITQGNEIWHVSGQTDFSYEPPDGFGYDVEEFKSLEIVIHRHRYDVPGGSTGGAGIGSGGVENPRLTLGGAVYTPVATDPPADTFGDCYKVILENVNSRQKPVLSFGPDDPGAEIQLSKATGGNGWLHVYSVLGRSRVWYSPDEIKLDKTIAEARIDGPGEVFVRLSYPAPDSIRGVVRDASGRELGLAAPVSGAVDPDYGTLQPGFVTTFKITPAAEGDIFSLTEAYTVSFEGYGESRAAVGNYFTSEGFEGMYTYDGELGAIYSPAQTTFRLWSPVAATAYVNLYPTGADSAVTEAVEMTRGANGTWEATVAGDLKNTYYTYTVNVGGQDQEAVDPYAKAAGVNGKRGMVVDLRATDPAGWTDDARQPFTSPVDAVIYELHIRDFSISESSGMVNKGKYLAFTETGTKNPDGLSTGIDHIKDLGVTHVHLLPAFDFRSIDETRLDLNKFNWGYDPENYNLPEGSYSTDPYEGNTRITEFKQMVQSLHNNGLRVVMDVVYNHTGATSDSNLNRLVPNYYYRQNASGGFSNGSGCGNETASERAMVRKLIVDSIVYWVTEYHIDGFRFDLMGLHDIETMNAVRAALDAIDPTILIYGEGWTGGGTPLPENEQAIKQNTMKLSDRIAVFSDDMRDGIKGGVFNATESGFITGIYSRREDVMFGVVGSVKHPQINYSRVSYSTGPWANSPTQTINYASAHDNLSLWDKLTATRPNDDKAALLALNKMSALLVLTSQGIPFFQAGEELARSKDGDHNSYQSPDSVNMIRWDTKTEYIGLFDYYKGLIALRKAHPAFRLQTADAVTGAVTFMDTRAQVLAYKLDGSSVADGTFIVAVNADVKEQTLELPEGSWVVLVNGDTAGTEAIGAPIGAANGAGGSGNTLTMAPKTGYVLMSSGDTGKQNDTPETPSVATPEPPLETPSESPPAVADEPAPDSNLALWLWGGLGAACVIVGIVFIARKSKKSA